MAQDPAFLFYYKDVLVSCADWDEHALAWYVRLLCHQADKQTGLPNDVEKLAVLAGVQFSKYALFVECWQHTLSAKFEANAQGLLINKKQDKNLKERREYKEKQTQRGLVGHFMKVARKETSLSAEQYKTLSEELFSCLSVDNSKEENEKCFKRTLAAYIGNAIAIVNTIANKNEEKGGAGEKEEKVLDNDLLLELVFIDKDYRNEIEATGVPPSKVEKWMQAFNRYLRFKGVRESGEVGWRLGFPAWLKHQNLNINPEDYKPANYAKNQRDSGVIKLVTSERPYSEAL